jgi:hypothetical protein
VETSGGCLAGNAAADMASLLEAVRNAGTNSVVIAGASAYSSDFSQ